MPGKRAVGLKELPMGKIDIDMIFYFVVVCLFFQIS